MLSQDRTLSGIIKTALNNAWAAWYMYLMGACVQYIRMPMFTVISIVSMQVF